MKRIAVIGIGIMGNGIATNFLKHGYKVAIWNRTKEKLAELVKLGAIIANTPKEATEKADIIFEVSANDQSSRSIWTGEDGILAGATKEKILVVCSTLSISWVDELANICKSKQLQFFDMAMTGSRFGAENGKLVLLVGGNEKILNKIKPDLGAISEQILYFGKAGLGMRFKLILNMLQAIHLIGLKEALILAKKTGLDPMTVGEALAEKPGGAPTKSAWIGYQKEPIPVNFSLEWITKDLRYVKELAGELDMPYLDEALREYTQALEKNLGSKDWTQIIKT